MVGCSECLGLFVPRCRGGCSPTLAHDPPARSGPPLDEWSRGRQDSGRWRPLCGALEPLRSPRGLSLAGFGSGRGAPPGYPIKTLFSKTMLANIACGPADARLGGPLRHLRSFSCPDPRPVAPRPGGCSRVPASRRAPSLVALDADSRLGFLRPPRRLHRPVHFTGCPAFALHARGACRPLHASVDLLAMQPSHLRLTGGIGGPMCCLGGVFTTNWL